MASYPNNIFATGSYRPTANEPLIINKHWDSIANEIPAIENELGTNPAGSYTDVKSRMDAGGVGTAISVNASAPDNSLTIDANGHVFRNNLPAFNVKNSTAGSAFLANATATWDVEILDNNNDFDLANNRFVVPVDGVYYIAARILSNAGTSLQYYMAINGVNAPGTYCENSVLNNNYRQGISHGVFNLSANDYITVYMTSAGDGYGGEYSNFCGYLIG